MNTSINTYQQQNIKDLIWQSVARLDRYQQIKLLEFINSMIIDVKQETNALLKYAGCIPENELELIKTAITDCEKIDHNEC
ncbi:MAG: hypothetical protein CSB01_01695 [Bacteroidia bacterium]|nr:MAG: hypothetical protein CSB01_01695 [Bacteroidia bacterium]